MTERSSGQKRQTWTVPFVAAALLIPLGVGWRGFSSRPSARAGESPGGPPKAQRLPDDWVAVPGATYAPLDGLAPGSREAQERQRQAVQQLGLPLEVKTRKTGIVFRLVPAGSFTMGSPKAEKDALVKTGVPRAALQDEMEHQATLTKAFYCGKFEVTQGQWEAVMGMNPSYFKDAGKDAPVEKVSWDDCQAFLKKLCEMEGVPQGTYRLLTEAQWECACRAGTQTALYNGDWVIQGVSNAPVLDQIAWYAGNSGVDYAGAFDSSNWLQKQYDHKRAGTHPVGSKRANGFGLCDMIGNVWEWCEDWHGDYPLGSVTDPLGPRSGDARVVRGGGWILNALSCRSAFRNGYTPGRRLMYVGLRVARTTALDLETLMGLWGQEIPAPSLVAHWRLDESQGDIASDSAGTNDGLVVGATWWPEGGAVGGALAFDGVDDRVAMSSPVNPVNGPFSILAWVKSDVAGRVVLSQSGAYDWLLTDSAGALTTTLKNLGRNAAGLSSQTIIVDGQWHRVGLTWENPRRTLLVDGVVVAEDEPGPPPIAAGTLCIGAGSTLDPTTFWSGLIDDVRIYVQQMRQESTGN